MTSKIVGLKKQCEQGKNKNDASRLKILFACSPGEILINELPCFPEVTRIYMLTIISLGTLFYSDTKTL